MEPKIGSTWIVEFPQGVDYVVKRPKNPVNLVFLYDTQMKVYDRISQFFDHYFSGISCPALPLKLSLKKGEVKQKRVYGPTLNERGALTTDLPSKKHIDQMIGLLGCVEQLYTQDKKRRLVDLFGCDYSRGHLRGWFHSFDLVNSTNIMIDGEGLNYVDCDYISPPHLFRFKYSLARIINNKLNPLRLRSIRRIKLELEQRI